MFRFGKETTTELTRRTDYAVRILWHLAEHPGEIISVREIAEQKKVPYAFARSIQRDLIEGGLVTTKLGAAGGAQLAKDPKDISLYEIITTVQGSISCAVCVRDPEWCEQSAHCAAHDTWIEIDSILKEFLESKFLVDLLG